VYRALWGAGIVSRKHLPTDGKVAALASSIIHALNQVAATSQTSREPHWLPARRPVGRVISILGRWRYARLTGSNTSLTIAHGGIVAWQEPDQRSGQSNSQGTEVCNGDARPHSVVRHRARNLAPPGRSPTGPGTRGPCRVVSQSTKSASSSLTIASVSGGAVASASSDFARPTSALPACFPWPDSCWRWYV
jgi:hypothetical protein